MPSPTSTSDDSDDDVDKRAALEESFADDSDSSIPPEKKIAKKKVCPVAPAPTKIGASSSSAPATRITISVLILLVAAAVGGYPFIASSSTTFFADLNSNSDGTNPILRYLAHGEIRARERKQEKQHHTFFHEKKSKHIPNETKPPVRLTKTSSSNRGVVDVKISGKDLEGQARPLMMYFSPGADSEETAIFTEAANKFGFVFGTPETAGQTYWTAKSPVPSDTGSIQNVIKSVTSVIGSQGKGSVDQSKTFVAAKPANFGIIVYRVDVYSSHWEEVQVPAKFGESWDDVLTWLH